MSDRDSAMVVQAFYRKVLAGAVEQAVSDYLAEDTVWDNPLPERIPYGGTFSGRAEAMRYLAVVFETLDLEAFEIDEIISSGDRVVVLGRETGRVKSSGRSYDGRWVHVIRVRDGRICHIREYNDTAEMLAAFD